MIGGKLAKLASLATEAATLADELAGWAKLDPRDARWIERSLAIGEARDAFLALERSMNALDSAVNNLRKVAASRRPPLGSQEVP